MKPRHDIYPILALTLVAIVVQWFTVLRCPFHFDSYSYITDSVALFDDHTIPYWRPPVYLFFIRLAMFISDSHWYMVLPGMQTIAYLGSVTVLWYLCRRINLGRWASDACALVFGVMPFFNVYAVLLLAECFAMTGILLWLLCVVEYLQRPRSRWIWLSGIITFFMWFLKPVFVVLIPLQLWFWWRYIPAEHRRKGLSIISSLTAVTVIAAVAYFFAFKERYGIFSMSVVPTVNNFYMVEELDILSPDDVDDPETRSHLFTPDGRVQEFNSNYPGAYNQAISKAIVRHPLQVAGYLLNRVALFPQSTLCYLECHSSSAIFPLIYNVWLFGCWWMYLVLILYFAAWLRRRAALARFGHLPAVLATFCICMIITNILGAMYDYGRLMSPFFSCFIILAAISIAAFRTPLKNASDPLS